MNSNIKALFFAQYFGQKVFMLPGWELFNDDTPMDFDYAYLVPESHYLISGYLLLRSVYQLTDEENEIYIVLGNDNYIRYVEGIVNSRMKICQSGYLRSIGILLPFTYLNEESKPITLQPEEIIALGWAKIK